MKKEIKWSTWMHVEHGICRKKRQKSKQEQDKITSRFQSHLFFFFSLKKNITKKSNYYYYLKFMKFCGPLL